MYVQLGISRATSAVGAPTAGRTKNGMRSSPCGGPQAEGVDPTRQIGRQVDGRRRRPPGVVEVVGVEVDGVVVRRVRPSTPGPSRPSVVRSRPASGAGAARRRVRDRRPRRWRGCPSAATGPSVEWSRRRRATARRGARRSDRRHGPRPRSSRPIEPSHASAARSPPPARPARSGRAPAIGSAAPPRRPSPSSAATSRATSTRYQRPGSIGVGRTGARRRHRR